MFFILKTKTGSAVCLKSCHLTRVIGVRQYWRQEGAAVEERCGSSRTVWHAGAGEAQHPLCGLHWPACHRSPVRWSRCAAVLHYRLILLGAATAASFAALLGAVKEAAFAVVACLFSQQCWLIPCNSIAFICDCCNDKSCRELRHRGSMKEWSKASSSIIIWCTAASYVLIFSAFWSDGK